MTRMIHFVKVILQEEVLELDYSIGGRRGRGTGDCQDHKKEHIIYGRPQSPSLSDETKKFHRDRYRDQIFLRLIPRLFFETKIFETDTETFFVQNIFETDTVTFFRDQNF